MKTLRMYQWTLSCCYSQMSENDIHFSVKEREKTTTKHYIILNTKRCSHIKYVDNDLFCFVNQTSIFIYNSIMKPTLLHIDGDSHTHTHTHTQSHLMSTVDFKLKISKLQSIACQSFSLNIA